MVIGAATASGTSASSTVTIQSDIVVSLTGASASNPILTASTINLTAAITSAGLPAAAIVWTVNGVTNGNSQSGTIAPGANGTAVYTAPSVQPAASVQIIATSVADPSKSASATQTVQGILLSRMTGIPGSVLTLTGNFNTSSPVQLNFSDTGSYSAKFSVTPDSATQATVVVPLYPSSTGFGPGTVSVSATQQSMIGTAPGFGIQALPAAAGPLGAVTLAALKQAYEATAEEQTLWNLVGTASGGKVTTAGVASTTSAMQTHLLSLIGAVSQVANGGAGFSIGTISGSPMQVNADTLALMDAVYQAFVINNPGVQRAISSLPAQALAELHVSATTRTAEENLRAFGAIRPLPHLLTPIALVGSAVAIIGAIATGTAVAPVALAAAVAISIAMAVDGVLTPTLQAVKQVLENALNALGPIANAEADEIAVQTAVTAGGVTLSGDEASLLSDLQDLEALLDPNNANSPGAQANNDQPTIGNNAPTIPASNSTPTINAIGYTVPLTGQILLNVWVQNAPPDVSYTVTSTWGDSAGVTVDGYGYGFQALVTPVPPSGGCYQGTISLEDSTGHMIAAISGCWGSSTDGTLAGAASMSFNRYKYSGCTPTAISVNPEKISLTMTQGQFTAGTATATVTISNYESLTSLTAGTCLATPIVTTLTKTFNIILAKTLIQNGFIVAWFGDMNSEYLAFQGQTQLNGSNSTDPLRTGAVVNGTAALAVFVPEYGGEPVSGQSLDGFSIQLGLSKQ
jgi:hypothetical protein